MITSFKRSTSTVRRAVVLTALALVSFAMPIIWTFVFRLYAQGFGLFVVLYFIFAIPATGVSIIASRRREWQHSDGGKRLLLALYGSPIIMILLLAGWALRR
jgi:Kef-type K+ transport system membrane component KefB